MHFYYALDHLLAGNFLAFVLNRYKKLHHQCFPLQHGELHREVACKWMLFPVPIWYLTTFSRILDYSWNFHAVDVRLDVRAHL